MSYLQLPKVVPPQPLVVVRPPVRSVNCRRVHRPEALPGWLQSLVGGPPAPETVQPSSSAAGRELLQLLRRPVQDPALAAELVEELSTAAGPFDEELLAGGPWVVRHFLGVSLMLERCS